MNHAGGLLLGWLEDPDVGWSMGTVGAVAEFVRERGEPTEVDGSAVVTDRGGIRLDLPDALRVVAYETPAGPHDHWNHAVALCLPDAAARRPGRGVVTELGPDRAALRPVDRDAPLFDLGLGTHTVDVCVRTADPDLACRLRAARGRSLFEPGSTLAAAVVAAGPHRVFETACGRAEVYAAIPAPDGRSPDGPHTHLLPHLLRPGRTHTPTTPVPAGHLPCAHAYPPHPRTDHLGRVHPFDQRRHDGFQALLDRWGDADQAQAKAAVLDAVRAGRTPPSPGSGAAPPPVRAAVSVALRQLAHLDGPSELLTAWRTAHGIDPDLLDPDGDRNAG